MPAGYRSRIDQLRTLLNGRSGIDVRAELESHLERILVAALAADDSGRYVGANRAAEALTGYRRSELIGMRVEDLTPVGLGPDGRDLWRRFLELGEQRGEYELRMKGGQVVRVQYWAYARVAADVHLSLLKPVADARLG